MERHFDVAIYSVPSSSFIFLKYLIGAKPEIEAMTFRSTDQRANKTFVTGRLASARELAVLEMAEFYWETKNLWGGIT